MEHDLVDEPRLKIFPAPVERSNIAQAPPPAANQHPGTADDPED